METQSIWTKWGREAADDIHRDSNDVWVALIADRLAPIHEDHLRERFARELAAMRAGAKYADEQHADWEGMNSEPEPDNMLCRDAEAEALRLLIAGFRARLAEIGGQP